MSVVTYLRFKLTLKSPAIVSGLMSDPNTVSTMHYIPGSMLRGVVASRLGDPEKDPKKQAEFRSLVLNGQVAWLNAYPVVAGKRSVPVPVALRKDKHAQPPALASDASAGESSGTSAAAFDTNRPFECFDLIQYDGTPDDDHLIKGHWPEKILAGLGDKFLASSDNQLHEPAISGRLHQQRDRPQGRAWTDRTGGGEVARGTIFSYESLDAGQTFSGCVRVSADNQAQCDLHCDRIKELLNGIVLLGRSRRAEYGGDAQIKFDEVATARELDGLKSLLTRDVLEHEQFVMLVTSTCLVRNPETGQLDPAALKKVVEARFEHCGQQVKAEQVRYSFETIGGFNRKWRLELPQGLAVAAGASVLLKAVSPIPLATLEAIEHSGIGERRAEGLGRVAFIEYVELSSEAKPRMLRKWEVPKTDAERLGDAPQLVLKLEQRMVTAAIERQVSAVAGELLDPNGKRPTNSLLGRLREPLRNQSNDAACTRAIKQLTTWLDDRDGNPHQLKEPAMKQLRIRCLKHDEVSRVTLGDWLKVVINDKDIGRRLKLESVRQSCQLVSEDSVRGVIRDQQDRLKVRLIDAVLAGLATLNRSERPRDVAPSEPGQD